MIGTAIKTLKEEIIEILLQKPASSKRIQVYLKQKGINVTVQAVYKQLNTLLESEVILKNKKDYIINNEWIKNVSKIIDVQDIELPEEGEKFTYKFNSLQKLDMQWKHIMSAFRKNFSNEAFFSYCPHQIWIYLNSRTDSEINYREEHEEKRYYNFYTIGGNTDLDRKFKKSFQGDYYRVETYEIATSKRNIHLSIFENTIIQTKIDIKLSNRIDSIYNSKKSITEKEKEIIELLNQNQTCTFTIENNKKKALKLKRQISQPFFLPENIREKIKKQSL